MWVKVMEKMSIEEIIQIMNTIHRNKKKIYTNYYANCNNNSHVFDVFFQGETIVFGFHDYDIHRVFYYSSDKKELLSCLKQVPKGAILDIVTREAEFDIHWIEGTGFRLYSTYGRFERKLLGCEEEQERMSHDLLDSYYNEQYGEYAQIEDVEEIQKIIRNVFDEKADHLFSDDNLRELIRKNWVIVQRENHKIFCIYIFKIEGKKLYSNFSYNEGAADVLYSIERRVLLDAIKNYEVNYSYAWFSLANKQALKRSYMTFDHTFNYIYVKEN